MHGPLVWQTAWRLLGHEADAADCFQETFVSAMETDLSIKEVKESELLTGGK